MNQTINILNHKQQTKIKLEIVHNNHLKNTPAQIINLVNKQISYQNQFINWDSNYFQTQYQQPIMFTPSLDHLNILVMLVIAFFSFRAYNNNTLAIEYEPEEEKVERRNQQGNGEVVEKQEEFVESSEMRSEEGEDVPEGGNSPSADLVEAEPNDLVNVESANSANLQSDLLPTQTKHHEIITAQGSLQKIEDESSDVNQPESLEKQEDQESTLVRVESRMEQEDDEQNVDCSSSSDEGSQSSSDDDQEVKESRTEKRKRIQKEKRMKKRNLRREIGRRVENVVELVEIQ